MSGATLAGTASGFPELYRLPSQEEVLISAGERKGCWMLLEWPRLTMARVVAARPHKEIQISPEVMEVKAYL